MKTTFLKILMLLLMISLRDISFVANSVNEHGDTEFTWISNFYKIEVRGNIQLHLLSGEKNRVEINSTYYDHNALVKVENGLLRIITITQNLIN